MDLTTERAARKGAVRAPGEVAAGDRAIAKNRQTSPLIFDRDVPSQKIIPAGQYRGGLSRGWSSSTCPEAVVLPPGAGVGAFVTGGWSRPAAIMRSASARHGRRAAAPAHRQRVDGETVRHHSLILLHYSSQTALYPRIHLRTGLRGRARPGRHRHLESRALGAGWKVPMAAWTRPV